ncbi:MAG: hypothetical protein A3B38_04190 [Candidatus Levybacteria bacterium RIFCSPLOWO2_01_FULL_36_13]|nr:MAG: hypothetical protein A2684_01115 [Candidatus Levybacteria bacterium RIFCSPHIGHO2_01_FULL_36_15b]OGH34326.1 MAG: hypothetical protein A3B38_04190 [Candidatus Levybacteria bacterium RIFCSPLOWO2_01_FULL_36_13]
MDKKTKIEHSKNEYNFPPVVAVLGHVDHGKTSLLDAIRKTNIAGAEHGGITQKIGASSIKVTHEGKERRITFIDTPGHEAFTKMRGRGAQAADIGILVVSAVDGVMPQTKESITLLKASEIPFIVAFTKVDDPQKLVDKAKDQLLKEEVMLEGYGGDIPFIEVSAKEGHNIKELLDLILLIFDLKLDSNFYHFSKDGQFKGIVIESKLDQKKGPLASVVVKNGKLSLKDELFSPEGNLGKVKNLISATSENIKEAEIGEAVEILGFAKAPTVGSVISTTKVAAEEIVEAQKAPALSNSPFERNEENMIPIVLCADTLGSLEAIKYSLPEKAKIVKEKTGEIEVSDVLYAKSTGAIVLGFNVKLKPEILKLAKTEKILVKSYSIIYEMIDEINDFVQGKLEALQEEVFGIGKILASFPYEKTKVMGIKVQEGRIAKNDKLRLIRNDEVIGESHVASLRQGKEQVSKIEEGAEGGIIISPFLDFTIGDMVLSHN